MTISMRPLGRRLVIEPIEQEEITAGGIGCRKPRKKNPRRVLCSPLVLATVMTRATASP